MYNVLELCLEEEATGVTSVETEKVFYASIDSGYVLSKAAEKEHQEQYQIVIPKGDLNIQGGRIRVRATTKDGGETEYVLTIKTKAEDGENETSQLVSKDIFEQVRLLASNGMIKTRYFFPIEGREERWEVDVFKIQEGYHKDKQANWCKIDYEFIDKTNREIPPFPDGFSDIIAGDTVDPEEKEFIRSLYEDIFITKMV